MELCEIKVGDKLINDYGQVLVAICVDPIHSASACHGYVLTEHPSGWWGREGGNLIPRGYFLIPNRKYLWVHPRYLNPATDHDLYEIDE